MSKSNCQCESFKKVAGASISSGHAPQELEIQGKVRILKTPSAKETGAGQFIVQCNICQQKFSVYEWEYHYTAYSWSKI